MRYRTKRIELEAYKYDGEAIPEPAAGSVAHQNSSGELTIRTSEGERVCKPGDYLVVTDDGQLLVRGGAIFETIFEPAE